MYFTCQKKRIDPRASYGLPCQPIGTERIKERVVRAMRSERFIALHLLIKLLLDESREIKLFMVPQPFVLVRANGDGTDGFSGHYALQICTTSTMAPPDILYCGIP